MVHDRHRYTLPRNTGIIDTAVGHQHRSWNCNIVPRAEALDLKVASTSLDPNSKDNDLESVTDTCTSNCSLRQASHGHVSRDGQEL